MAHDIIERDVRRHVAARSTTTLHHLGKSIFESAGSELSANKLAKMLGIATDTALSYIDAFSKAYLIQPCHYFTFSERKRAMRNTKWHPIDCGMRRAVISSGTPDIGKSFESIVYYELRRRYGDVYYWRDTGEVDFVVLDDNRPLPIQVTWYGIKARHKEAVAAFQKKHSNALEAQYITQENFSSYFA